VTTPKYNSLSHWYAPLVIVAGLISILQLHLVAGYLTALFIFFAVRKTASWMPRSWSPRLERWIAFLTLIFMLGFLITMSFIWGINHLYSVLTERALLDTLSLGWERFLSSLPPIIAQYLPSSFGSLLDQFADLIGGHWDTVGAVSRAGVHTLVLSIVGLVIGILIALEPPHHYKGVFDKLATEVDRAARAFWEVISAQVLISLINTLLTCIYLLVLLPAFNVSLPYPAILIIVTFIAGLLPILGNLLSNTIIVLFSFTVSAHIAISSLAFLVVIHKLEYLLNAKIIAMHIQAKPWELLIAFFVADAAFGVPGLMVAPFFYGYYKLLITERRIA
jgi:predicted PurR-regulated permease PerM